MALSAYARWRDRRPSETMRRFFTPMGSGRSRIHEGGIFCPFYRENSGGYPTRNLLGNGGGGWPGGQLGGLAGTDPGMEGGDLGTSENPARPLSEKPSPGNYSWWTENGLGFASGGGGQGVPLGDNRAFNAGCHCGLPGCPEKANPAAIDRPLESNGTCGLGRPPQGRGIHVTAGLPAHGNLSVPKEMNRQARPSPSLESGGGCATVQTGEG
jgi:hypothetical protein